MSNKRFEVEIEVIELREVTVWAEDFADAIEKANRLDKSDLREGYVNDMECRVLGVRRNKLQRMYRDN